MCHKHALPPSHLHLTVCTFQYCLLISSSTTITAPSHICPLSHQLQNSQSYLRIKMALRLNHKRKSETDGAGRGTSGPTKADQSVPIIKRITIKGQGKVRNTNTASAVSRIVVRIRALNATSVPAAEHPPTKRLRLYVAPCPLQPQAAQVNRPIKPLKLKRGKQIDTTAESPSKRPATPSC